MTGPDSDRQRRRQAAVALYSAAVRWMKIILPVGAVALIGMIFLSGQDRGAIIDLGSSADLAALGAGLKLDKPRFSGVTADGDPFYITADWALPDGAMPNQIDLERPRGELRLGNGLLVNMRSNIGQMMRKDEELHLTGEVEVQSSDGYRAETDTVTFHLNSKTAVVPGRVEATGPRGTLIADRMTVRRVTPESRDIIVRFEGNVRVTYLPKGEED